MPFDLRRAAAPLPDAVPEIRLDGVALRLGGHARLDGLDLAIGGRGLTVLMGPNGAGKSLTLRLIYGLETPSAGRVSYGGAPPLATNRRIGFIPQKPALLRRTVRGDLAHALRAFDIPRRERSARLASILEGAGLSDRADQPARALSGGEQQRYALARALAAEPETLLLDEPTASLDPVATAEIERVIRAARADGRKIVLVTHDVGQARRLADDVVFLHRGRVVEQSDAASFFDAPRSEEARVYLRGGLLT